MNQSFHIQLDLKEWWLILVCLCKSQKRFHSSILLIPILSTCTGLEGGRGITTTCHWWKAGCQLSVNVLAVYSLVETRDFSFKILSLVSVINGTGVCFRSWFDLFKRNEEWKFKTQWSVTFSRKRRSISSYRYISLSHNGCDDRKFQEWFFTTGEKKPAEAF